MQEGEELQQGTWSGTLALAKSVWRAVEKNEKAGKFLRQSVEAGVLIFALGGWIKTGMPYASFLLAGLAPWFFTKEIFEEAPKLPSLYAPVLRTRGWSMGWLAVAKALAALPVLVVWLAVALVAAYVQNIRLVGLSYLPYAILCCFWNAATQSMLASALAPLFRSKVDTSMLIMLPILFWTTPLVWPASILPRAILIFAELNPLFYAAEVMRGAVCTGVLPSARHTLLFFSVSAAYGLCGYWLTKRVWKAALPE